MDKPQKRLKAQIRMSVLSLLTLMAVISVLFTTHVYAADTPQEEITVPQSAPAPANALNWALLAAAIAFGMGAISAGFAISHVGAAAMGARRRTMPS